MKLKQRPLRGRLKNDMHVQHDAWHHHHLFTHGTMVLIMHATMTIISGKRLLNIKVTGNSDHNYER